MLRRGEFGEAAGELAAGGGALRHDQDGVVTGEGAEDLVNGDAPTGATRA